MSVPTQRADIIGQLKSVQAILREVEIAAGTEVMREGANTIEQSLFGQLAYSTREFNQELGRFCKAIRDGNVLTA